MVLRNMFQKSQNGIEKINTYNLNINYDLLSIFNFKMIGYVNRDKELLIFIKFVKLFLSMSQL